MNYPPMNTNYAPMNPSYSLMQQRPQPQMPQMPQMPPGGPPMGPEMGGPGMQVPPGMGPQAPGAGGPGGGVDAALMHQVLATNGAEAQQEGINRQRKLADMLRASAKDQLQGAGMVGKRYIAPNWGNVAASAASSFLGAGQEAQAQKDQTQLGTDQTNAAEAWFRAKTGGRR